MSCSDIKVTILGDVANITVLVNQAQQSATAAAASATAAAASAVAAKDALDKISTAAPALETDYKDVVQSITTRSYNFKGDGVKVVQTSPGKFDITIDGETRPIPMSDVQGLIDVINRLESEKIDEVIGDVDADKKTITLNMISKGNVIKTNTIDLSAMFGNVTPNPLPIYYGFTAAAAPNEAVAKSGSRSITSIVNGLDITITRPDSDQKYMYIWIPDAFGPVIGFKFSGTFVDVWASTSIAVDGVPGKAYISDNRTAAKSVTIEVMQ